VVVVEHPTEPLAVPAGYWQPYFYNSCYWVLTAVYDMALIQIANPDF